MFDKFRVYNSKVENQLEKKIKILRSDRDGKYAPTEMGKFCEDDGVIHQVTPSYAPQYNGVGERKKQALTSTVNAMLLSLGLPNSFWDEALYSACLILNRVPNKNSNKTPMNYGRTQSLI